MTMTKFERSCYKCGRDRGFEFFRFAIEEARVDCGTQDGDYEDDDMVDVDEDSYHDTWVSVAGDCEEINRQFSPWEMVAVAINSNSQEEYCNGWDAYSQGISTGMEIAGWLQKRGTKLQPRVIYGIPESESESESD